METPADVTLRLPPRPELLQIVRVVTTSLAALADMEVDDADDLCIAVDEAASVLLRAGAARAGLSIRFKLADDAFEAVVSGDGLVDEWPPGGVESIFARRVLATLTDTHSIEIVEGVARIRLVKEIVSRA